MEKTKAIEIISETKRNYNLIAKDWNVSRGFPSPVKIKLLRNIKKDFRVLDLGCGNGLMAGEVLKRGGRYFGVDISAKLIAIARKKNKRAKFIVADALNLPFKKNQFDFIFSFAVLHHIPSDELRKKFLKEIFRVLKPGGRVVLTSWNLLEDWAREKYDIKKQLKNISAGYDRGDVFVPWKGTRGKKVMRFLHHFSTEDLSGLVKIAGFKKAKVEYYDRSGKKKKNGEMIVLKITKMSG